MTEDIVGAVEPSENGGPKLWSWTIIWQWIASVLVTALLTGVASWVSFGRDKVTRAEMVNYVETEGPYARDRQIIYDAIGRANTLDRKVSEIRDEQVRNSTKIDEMSKQIHDLWILHQPKKDQ